MDQGIVKLFSASWRHELVAMVLVPQMSHKSVQMGQENASSARYAMAKPLGKMLKFDRQGPRDYIPKLRVAGSNPVARSRIRSGNPKETRFPTPSTFSRDCKSFCSVLLCTVIFNKQRLSFGSILLKFL